MALLDLTDWCRNMITVLVQKRSPVELHLIFIIRIENAKIAANDIYMATMVVHGDNG